MRIALFHNLPSGGAKRNVYETTRRLSRQHQIDVYTLSCAEHEFGDVRAFVNAHNVYGFRPLPLLRSPLGRFNQLARWLDIFRLRRIERRMAAQIQQGGYDVALVHPCILTTGPALLQFLRIPSVYYCHDTANLRSVYEPALDRPYLRKTRMRAWMDGVDPWLKLYRVTLMRQDQASYRSASRVLTNSDFTREALFKIYGRAAHTCYCGIDSLAFRPGKPGRSRRVLSVGMLMAAKGFDFLIESLATLPSCLRIPLTIVSNQQDEREKEYLLRLAGRLEVEIELKRMISGEELAALYGSAALTLYAPVREPFGLVPLESQACGTPVIGVREGGVRETIIDGTTGLLCEREPQQFASAARMLLNDPALIEQMGRAGRKYVEESWTWERAIAQLEGHLSATARQSSPHWATWTN